jgi:hypothetical protein
MSGQPVAVRVADRPDAAVDASIGASAGVNVDKGHPVTRPGSIIGTTGYMAPEQVLGEPATFQSDLFAFGIVVHEMLTGVHPFGRGTPSDTQLAILRDDPALLARAVPTLPPAIARVVERCLQKRQSDRPESARDLALFLEATGSVADPTVARESTAPAPAATPLLAMAVAAVVILVASTWWLTRATAARAVDDAIATDLARAERILRRMHGDRLTRLATTARLVASFPELKALFATDVATIEDFLRAYQQRVAGTATLMALAPDGTMLASTDDRSTRRTIDENWVRTLIATQGEGTVANVGNHPYVAAAAAAEAGGTIFGYIVAAEPIERAFAEAASESMVDDVVLLSDREVLASTLRADLVPWHSLGPWRAAGGRTDRAVDTTIGTQRAVAREVTLTTNPAVSVVVVDSKDDAMEPYLRIQRGLGVIALVVLAATIAGGLALSRRRAAAR